MKNQDAVISCLGKRLLDKGKNTYKFKLFIKVFASKTHNTFACSATVQIFMVFVFKLKT